MAGNYNEEISNNLDDIRKELRIANELKLAELYLDDATRVMGEGTHWTGIGQKHLASITSKLYGGAMYCTVDNCYYCTLE